MVEGTVKYWNDDEAWGVLTSSDVPGEVWTHFSCIVGSGYRSLGGSAHYPLGEGDRVRFSCEHYPPGQDGYFWRAFSVVPMGEGSEFAHLSDEQIEERIKEIEQGVEAESAKYPGAFTIEQAFKVFEDGEWREVDP